MEQKQVLDLEKDFSQMEISRVIKLRKFKEGESFATFCDRFILHVEMAGLARPDLHLLFLQAVDDNTFETLKREVEKLSDREKADPRLFCEKFKDIMYGNDQGKIFLQQEVFDCKQKKAESIADYVIRLRGKADIAYDSRKDAENACFFSFRKNLADKVLLRKLKEAAPLNFDEAVKRAKLLETVAQEEATNPIPILKQESITFERRSDYRSDRPSYRYRSSSGDRSINWSRDSSRERSHDYKQTSRSSVVCWNCNKRGHYRNQCRSSN